MLDSQMNGEKPEIAFFDVETTVPTRPGQGFALLEFGSILVCPRRLEELRSYSTLVRPSNPTLISALSVRCNGITPDSVESAPSFAEIADTVYDILNGRIWAGHNILRFDCPRIKEAFADIGHPPPEPKGIIDSLALLTQKFGRRAGDMKMASLATYFGLGKQKHRSLDDVRMNLEVLKYCATVLFLESSLPEAFPEKSWVSPNATTRSHKNGKSSPEGPGINTNAPSSSSHVGNISPPDQGTDRTPSFLSLLTSVASNTTQSDPFDMRTLSSEMNTESLEDVSMEERTLTESSLLPSSVTNQEGCNSCPGFLEPDEVTVSSIKVAFVPFFRGTQKMILLHEDVPLQLYCPGLKVKFGISTKFTDYAGRPRLSFVVEPSANLLQVLEACDGITQKMSVESGSSSEWRHVVNKRQGYVNYPTIRLNIPTIVNEDVAQFATDMYQKDPSGSKQKLVFSSCDAAELDTWLTPGTILDACFTLEPYDFRQMAGIRLVAKQLIVHQE
ncbi:protein NEN1-like [Euphorbia lathyris]|uniref:protein NEN1-like n=1 Tax=Euphorbia lathyris TaxID=212925 RepID=UPI00331357B6